MKVPVPGGVVVIPLLAEVAGFEIGSGININTALLEKTAQFVGEQKGRIDTRSCERR